MPQIKPTAALDALLRKAVEDGTIHGISACASKDGKIIYSAGFGKTDMSDPCDPMTVDTPMRIFSMTKALTCVCVMQLIERGRIHLKQEVREIIPDFADMKVLEGFDQNDKPILVEPKVHVTVKHLLTHTGGLSYKTWNSQMHKFMRMTGVPGVSKGTIKALKSAMTYQPGEKWDYGTNIDWLGYIVEIVSGQKLDQFMAENIFRPLGMSSTTFCADEEMQRRRLKILQRIDGGSLGPPKIREYPNGDKVEMLNGGHGCFGTAADYLKFVTALANGGSPILSEKSCVVLLDNHIGNLELSPLKTVAPVVSNDWTPRPGTKWSLIGERNETDIEGRRRAGSSGWAGLANTYFWCDPESRVAGVFCTQLFPFADPRIANLYEEFEKCVYLLNSQLPSQGEPTLAAPPLARSSRVSVTAARS